MDKLKPLLKLTGYITFFILCEFALHYLQTILIVGSVASLTLRIMEVISAIAGVIEAFEIATGLEVKEKFGEIFNQLWKKTTQKYFSE